MKKIIDNVGRITLPKDVRDKYNLNPGANYNLIEEDSYIRLEPLNKLYSITNEDMKALRKLYLMLSDSDYLDDYYDTILSKITKRSEIKCDKCNNYLFLTSDNTYKCFKCGE